MLPCGGPVPHCAPSGAPAPTQEVNRKLQALALEQVSTDCQLMTLPVPGGRRGNSVVLPQKRLRIRGKLVTSAEEGDMRHILTVFEAIQIHKQASRFGTWAWGSSGCQQRTLAMVCTCLGWLTS